MSVQPIGLSEIQLFASVIDPITLLLTPYKNFHKAKIEFVYLETTQTNNLR